MALDHIVPRVDIDESDVGQDDVQGLSLNRIGIVGEFPKGPLETRIKISSEDQAKSILGDYDPNSKGWLSLKAALNQGAQEFDIVRVAGDGSAVAKLTLKDANGTDSVTYTANSPGKWANGTVPGGIKIAVTSGSSDNTVKLVVISGTDSRTYDNIDLSNIESIKDDDGSFSKVEDAKALPATISATPLEGGSDGSGTKDDNYVGTIKEDGSRTGLKILETANSSLIIAAQQSSEAVRAALLTHSSNAGLEEGLRMSILNPDKGMSAKNAVALVSTIDNMRSIMPYPWLEPQELQGAYVAPDGYLAGVLASIKANKSPSNKEVKGILSTERELSGPELKALTLGRVMPITAMTGRGFRVRNGLTLSTLDAWSQVSIRRIFDEIEMEIYLSTQWAVSEDNTPDLWKAVADQIDIILARRKTDKEIYDYKPTICDDTINTPDSIKKRILNTKIFVRPIYAADYIDHKITRLVGNE